MVNNAQLWGGLFWLAIAAYVTWAGRDLGLGKLSEPGSGFALFWIGLMMCALAASVIVQAITKGSETLESYWEGTRWPKVLMVIVLLLVFGFYFERLGFLICAVGLLLVLMRDVNPLDWRVLPSILLLLLAFLIDFAADIPGLKSLIAHVPTAPFGLGTMHMIVAAFALLLVNLKHGDAVRWPTALAVTFGSAFGVWYVLTKLLKIQIPNGVMTPLLG